MPTTVSFCVSCRVIGVDEFCCWTLPVELIVQMYVLVSSAPEYVTVPPSSG